MREEVRALQDNGVWRAAKRSEIINPLHSKLVEKTKTGADDEMEQRKYRLVACVKEQVLEVAYNITFVAAMNMTAVKVVLALAETWGVPVKYGNITNAYVMVDKEVHLDICLPVLRWDGRVRQHTARSRRR
uniref:Reverse transcriptase Ty1/copia-type domain-containing protein n=1 Tax=Peronospora matthiolae TaxID=2874970 RepID=A0AAV1TI10_9STRA